MKLGLRNIRALLDALGAPDRRYAIVQVAGTNGKGSTSAYLAAGLRALGRRVGLFTSPHLVDFRERIRADGVPIGEAEVVHEWVRIRDEVERRNMTFFEANTAIALSHFARRGCDVAVLETGMGGRLDATTATDASACVLTRIAFDHRDYLGQTLREIAGEKAAILRGGAPALSAAQDPEVERAIREHAERAGSPLAFVPEPDGVLSGGEAVEFAWRGERVRLRMLGRHQAANAALALEALLRLAPEAAPLGLVAALGAVEVQGRFQCVPRPGGALVLDVAHNPDALGCFTRTLADAFPNRPLRLLLGMLRDKDLAGSLDVLSRVPGLRPPILVGSASSAPDTRRLRSRDWLELPEPRRRGSRWVGGILEGLAELDEWQAGEPRGVIAVVGSFTSVGEAMVALGIGTLGEA